MKIDLTGKRALVTGAGRDIGRAIAEALACSGAHVAVNYRMSGESAEAVVQRIRAKGGVAVAVQADVTKPDEVERMVQETVRQLGGNLDILINNAGGLVRRSSIIDMPEELWDQVINVNLKSVFLVTKAALKHFNDGGAIVNVASLAARNGGGNGAVAYAAAKGGVLSFTRGLAKELARRKIRVNCVSPGLINTTFHDRFTPQEVRQQVARATLAGREGEAWEVASSVVFLASDLAAYINGESLEINGGLYFV
ncbi:SDR family NAD(P)-dependent oxidoreductase [Rhodothermus profundi]|uniref:3-oxoacyl-[acyl-carrier protein] reductase n=1 Tax=Rhodothermus profundi TaxID=633813 RepID=A0A1M6T035_9BACT|nr:3-oxoacyl-ACP reductase family protein [Rhodothermus profundi]SHK50158.1 3-oxoacyl-[acyl-carrier protein] reductase [Rhodothermus profundi]